MVRLIMGGKGEGKTKQLMTLMQEAAETTTGSMVCIEESRNMSFSLRHQTRMVDAGEYKLDNFEAMRGFISGLYAGNYDISHIFIDDLLKIVKNADLPQLERFLLWIDNFTSLRSMKCVITVSGDRESATDVMRKFM